MRADKRGSLTGQRETGGGEQLGQGGQGDGAEEANDWGRGGPEGRGVAGAQGQAGGGFTVGQRRQTIGAKERHGSGEGVGGP